jgi:hypothetical protein
MKFISYSRFLFGLLLFSALVSCEDKIDISLDQGESQLAVDALVIVKDGPQTIRLTKTGSYFDNTTKAAGATGAIVTLRSNLGQEYIFSEDNAVAGNYVSADTIHAQTGEIFGLTIQYQGKTFGSASIVVRPTLIDTVYQEEREAEFGNEAGKYVGFSARDSVGEGDFCWMKYSLNGKNDLRYNRLGAAFPVDAAFAPGSADGLDFIYPIRNSINGEKGYLVGDTIGIELLSIDAEQWRFLKEMDIQLNNTGLFANPLANVRGNIFNADKNSKTQAVGCFGMARVSRGGVRFK